MEGKFNSKIKMGVIVFFAIACVISILYLVNKKGEKYGQTKIVMPQPTQKLKYVNELLKYEITYSSKWHISDELSKQALITKNVLASAQSKCDIGSDLSDTNAKIIDSKLGDCLKVHPEIQQQIEEILRDYDIKNSEIAILTALDSKSEDEFLNNVKNSTTTIEDLPGGIEIYPSDINTYPAKEATSGNLKIKFMEPIDDSKVFSIDTRSMGEGGSLVINVLNSKSTNANYKSLTFRCNCDPGTDSEKAFYDIVSSLKFE
ncbi:MAG: hypothetical protein WB930_12650 [Syntrophobacteraceae bacterium]